MSFVHYKDELLFFVSQWAGTTAPRLVAGFLGLLLVLLFVQRLWDKRLRVVLATIGIAFGGSLVAMAFDTRVLHWLAGLNDAGRLRLSVGLLSAMVLGTTFEAIRRAHLQERYALLWLGAASLTLTGTLFPRTLDLVGVMFGTDYTRSILAVLLVAVALMLFHVSLALSRSDHRESRLAQRCALLEDRLERLERQLDGSEAAPVTPAAPADTLPGPQTPPTPPGPAPRVRALSGTHVAAVAVIVASAVAVLWTGWRTPEPMLGDEVTHFYMLKNQSRQLMTPTFTAEIPVGWGNEPEVRRYPHVSGWHYLGALVYRISGGSFRAVQLWHTLFWLQFLIVGYLLARRRAGERKSAAVLYLMLLASLPAAIIFAVAFYQDIPVTAQILTAFYLLLCGRRRPALLFLLFALAIKETAFLFVPAFLALWGWSVWQKGAVTGTARWRRWRSAFAASALVGLLVLLYSLAWAGVLYRSAAAEFYPVASLQRTWHAWRQRFIMREAETQPGTGAGAVSAPAEKLALLATPYETQIIANHPGDLRIPKNYLLYGGVLIWLIAAAGLIVRAGQHLSRQQFTGPSSGWLWGIGLSYAIPAAYVLRTAPDARFFLPAIPFLLLPLTEWAVCIPRIKMWLALVTALALLQVGAVHSKIYNLRAVSPALREAIAYLHANPPVPRTVFMYPEGNYRLFPTPHNWYLNYRLREFWKDDNAARITMLQDFGIGALVIKKYLVRPVDATITDLGVYPDFFVRDIKIDQRFREVFDNASITIFLVPQR